MKILKIFTNKIIFLIFLIFVFIYLFYHYYLEIQKPVIQKPFEKFENQRPLNNETINEIPTNVFLTFITKDLPPRMEQTLQDNIANNPEFNFYVYDNDMCRQFILDNFGQNLVDVFDKLKPGAYKADLFRYCILYVHGGVYMDVKLKLHVKLKDLINKYGGEVFVKDLEFFCERGCNNGFLICKKNNPLLLDCINQIEQNYKEKYYGNTFLHPTGPCLLGNIILTKYNHVEYNLHMGSEGYFNLLDENDEIVISSYEGYKDDMSKLPDTKHYSELWNEKNIYE
jgi:mannosyltransferase OCH1-like enzyme